MLFKNLVYIKKQIKNRKLYLYFVYIPILFNFVLNIIKSNPKFNQAINYFYDSVSIILLFCFLLTVGFAFKQLFNLPYISTGIIFYLFSFFFIDNVLLFFYTEIQFSEIFIYVNSFWFLYFLINKKFKLILLTTSLYLFLNQFIYFFYSSLSKNKNVIGDVKDIHFEHVKNIYEKSYYYSINNPTLEGYPQLVAYNQALLNRLVYISDNFVHLALSINVLFLLSLLIIYESNLSNLSKLFSAILFTSLIFNSQWLKLLFVDSIMTEGLLSYLFSVLLISLNKSMRSNNKSAYITFFLLGTLYLSKQFISLLSILIVLFFLIGKRSRKYAIFGFSGIVIKELSSFFHFKNITKNYHLKETDLIDTVLDFIFLRDLKLENIITILKNLFLDKPFFILMIYFFILLFAYILNSNMYVEDLKLYSLTILLNLIFIFLLYISIWRNMELESPIRYMLNLLHLLIFTQFRFIDEVRNPK